ncbi:unnamed protein product [Ixodes hexagonus]
MVTTIWWFGGWPSRRTTLVGPRRPVAEDSLLRRPSSRVSCKGHKCRTQSSASRRSPLSMANSRMRFTCPIANTARGTRSAAL